MKKLVAILLLTCLLFNSIGYLFFINRFEKRADEKLEQAINRSSYNEAELLEVTIPLNMPYYSDKGTEYVYGLIEAGGKHYQYVKRQVKNNILHIWCMPDKEKNKISDFNALLSKSSTENNKDQHSNPVLKIMQAVFEAPAQNIFMSSTAPVNCVNKIFNEPWFTLFDPQTASEPPEA